MPRFLGSKENIRELDPRPLETELPTPKTYERTEGRKEVEIGFVAEELPQFLRRGNG
ncbi:hypothetical protein J7L29_05730 [Candidatus Bathyarchaeota archaeon]|nr:hypothetical protein [Candidatus Bathyarchaeota archaeon]